MGSSSVLSSKHTLTKSSKQQGFLLNTRKQTFELYPGFKPTVECWEHRYGSFRKREIKVQGITYTPDFTCPDLKWVIEVKGRANERFPLIWKMFRGRAEVTRSKLFLPTCEEDVDLAIQIILEDNDSV
jgi:hypothetical protein